MAPIKNTPCMFLIPSEPSTNRYKMLTGLRIFDSESYTEPTKAPCRRNAESVNVEAGDV